MKLGLLLPPVEDGRWKLAKQIGVDYAIAKLNPSLTGQNPPWDITVLKSAKNRFANAGLYLHALEGDQFDMNRIKLGLDGRDEDIERYKRMLENMGEVGVPILCYNFMGGIGWYRTDTAVPSRGGALASAFDLEIAKNDPPTEFGEVRAERVWQAWEYFAERVLPVAEKAGVMMCLHPDDPPLPKLRGIERILINADAFRRAQRFSASPANRITFCQSNFMLMGEDIEALIREFSDRIASYIFATSKARRNASRKRSTTMARTTWPSC